MKRVSGFAAFLLLGLGGCQSTTNWFNSVGDHLPVIGERCENWQCFTASGQAASDARKAQEQQQQQQSGSGVTTVPTPINQPQQQAPQPAPQPDANPSPAAAKALTPWDMYPTPSPSN